MRLAFAGFRHGHVMGLYSAAMDDPRVEVVAACEEDPDVARELRQQGRVTLTHDSFSGMLSSVNCDVIAVGDYFARRGELIRLALAAGKHVISDKPICTSLSDLQEIESLARSNNRVVSALFDLRDCAVYQAMRNIIRSGQIGEVHTVNITAQHPLSLASRPKWYFEPGKHGGTINDIGCHATDLIPWLTGQQIVQVVGARAWNARLPQHPQFQDAAQCMWRLQNNAGVLCDVSYLAPDAINYHAPQYWRVTCHGSNGFVETDYNRDRVMIATSDDANVRTISAAGGNSRGRLDDLLNEIAGTLVPGMLSTADVLRASRMALITQQRADEFADRREIE
jgi:predicted dehydrogenase